MAQAKTHTIKLTPKLAAALFVVGVLCLLGWVGRSGKAASPSYPPRVVSGKEAVAEAQNGTSKPVVGATQSSEATAPTKPKDTHASTILRSGEYEQHRYTALLTPSDTQYPGSWYHQKIQTNRAWDVTTGSSSTVIAVIDSGFALGHQELANKWYTSAGENGQTQVGDHCWTGTAANKATNNCDDDQNGYVDDWRGWDFNSSDNNPQTGMTNSTGLGTQHGTMVSGIIAASSNNAAGNAGIDWQAKIMPLQVLGDDGAGYTFDIVAAIEYATDNGANIINMSLGGPDFDQAMLDAVNYATAHGVLVIAASGNCGNSSTDDCAGMVGPGRMAYPGKYASVLSVGATNDTDDRAAFSSYGPELDVVAPGSSVGPLTSWSSSIPTAGYVTSASGTSFASPMVAGLAGLVRAKLGNPSVAQLRNAIVDSADKVPGLAGQNNNDTYGFGRINAHKATLLAQALASPPSVIGSSGAQGHQPKGALVRISTGNVQPDEWLLTVCRVETSDFCSGSAIKGGSTVPMVATNPLKGSEVYYLFTHAADLPIGTSVLSVDGRLGSTNVATVTR